MLLSRPYKQHLVIKKRNLFLGQTDTFLNDEGIKQAQLAGSKLCEEDFSHVFCSDLERAHKVSDNRLLAISNGSRTEWSPIQSVIIQVITKSDDRAHDWLI